MVSEVHVFSWRLVIGSAIIYVESGNITESRLAFREAIDDPSYEQNDNRGVQLVYGMQSTEDDPTCALNQPVGSVVTKSGQTLVFPNCYQHRVEPFELENKHKAGVRRILVFFLVDPTNYIVSTAHIAPQQREWYPPGRPDPPGTMSYKDALAYREELMAERQAFTKVNNEEVFQREFSLCEH